MSRRKLSHFRLFFDLDKELAYIGEMNRLGWKLDRVRLGCIYSFERVEPDEYVTLIYVEKRGKLEETLGLAERCGYEEIPHKADGLKRALYFTGRRDEVSPVFFNDEKSIIRAHRMMFKRLFVISIICAALALAVTAEVAALFAVPAILSGSEVLKYPSFFIMTIVFSAVALLFWVLAAVMIRSMLKMKNKLEALLPPPEKEAEEQSGEKPEGDTEKDPEPDKEAQPAEEKEENAEDTESPEEKTEEEESEALE